MIDSMYGHRTAGLAGLLPSVTLAAAHPGCGTSRQLARVASPLRLPESHRDGFGIVLWREPVGDTIPAVSQAFMRRSDQKEPTDSRLSAFSLYG